MRIKLSGGQEAEFDKVLAEHAVKADEAISKGVAKGKLLAVPHIAALVEAGDSVRKAVGRLPHVLNPKSGKLEPRKSSGAWQETYRTVTRLVKVGKVGPETMVKGLAETDWQSFADLVKAVDTAWATLEASGAITVRKVDRKSKTETERAMAYAETLVKGIRRAETEGIKRKDSEPIRPFNLGAVVVGILTGKAALLMFRPEKTAEETAAAPVEAAA